MSETNLTPQIRIAQQQRTSPHRPVSALLEFSFMSHSHQCCWLPQDQLLPMSSSREGRKWTPFCIHIHICFLCICIIFTLFKLLECVSKWLEHRQKRTGCCQQSCCHGDRRGEPWCWETCRRVINQAQKPGTTVWYCPVTQRQISNEDETFYLMLIINTSNYALRHMDLHSRCI